VPLPLASLMRDLQTSRRKAFIPFMTAGYPDRQRCRELLATLATSADVIEVGLPFSDPVADGPSICAASEVALQAGANTDGMFDLLEECPGLPPTIIMTYLNPVLAYGVEPFMQRAAAVGVRGILLTDLPPEDGEEILQCAESHGIGSVLLVAPTTSEQRMSTIAQRASAFLYCIAVRGITGARQQTSDTARDTVARLRKLTDKPIVVGFGISSPEHVRETCSFADGVVVGSALVDWIRQHADSPQLVAGFQGQVEALAAEAHR